MQQLTKSQIVELRARAIYTKRYPDSSPEEKGYGFTWKDFIEDAQATIEADEKAGVLILVEEGDVPLSLADNLTTNPAITITPVYQTRKE